VEGEIRRQLRQLKRRKIAEVSIKNRSFIIVAKNLKEGISLSNEIAPEHLQLSIKDPEKAVDLVTNAGAIFLGNYTPEACGDYIAGPSHVLPTTGNARFGSPLGVLDFLKISSVISFEPKAIEKFGETVIRLSEMEGLTGHSESVRLRLAGKPTPSRRSKKSTKKKSK
jgi:histidinol dehydrogenase